MWLVVGQRYNEKTFSYPCTIHPIHGALKGVGSLQSTWCTFEVHLVHRPMGGSQIFISLQPTSNDVRDVMNVSPT